jgi:hypothetical protein
MAMSAKPTNRDPEQAWFWSLQWQQNEAEADHDIAVGDVERYDSDEALIASFDTEADLR